MKMYFENNGNNITLTHQTITRKDKGDMTMHCRWCNERKIVNKVHVISGVYQMCSDECLNSSVKYHARKEGY